MKKQVLVSVDRGETRVALLESTGTPGAAKSRRRRRGKNPAAGYRVAELYFERRGNRSIVGNIYKGKVDNVLPGLEAAFVDIGLDKNGFLHVDEIVLPGRRDAPPRPRQGGRQEDRRPAQARAGDRRAGRQGPAEDQGRAPVDGPHHRGALHGLHADRRGRRRLQAPRRQGARAPAQARPAASTCRAAARSSARPPRAPSARTSSASCSTCSSSTRSCRSASRRPRRPSSSSRRPTSRSASCATSSRPTSSARSSTTRSSTTGWSPSSRAPRPSSSTASSSTRTPRRCSRPTASRTSSRASSRAASTCPPAAT